VFDALPRLEQISGNDLQPSVIHVEVKLADDDEDCYIAVIIWKCTIDNAGMLIENETDMPIVVQQEMALIPKLSGLLHNSPTPYEICILPGSVSPYGWPDPSREAKQVKILFGVTR
jgi:hypothetical protein